ncbi:UDP-N-acetylglucosamine 2-epimerase [Candidatus Pacearchaeota archaeon]|nr:UDP-N-acetylglucosamine 2-epimerase [Candidatus Pacearchaeota archaeon]
MIKPINKKNKIVMLVKKEYPFPDFWIFKKLNKFYWGVVFKIFIKREIKKYCKKQDFLVISDFEQYGELKKICENVKIFEDYAEINEPYVGTYPEASKLAEEWLNKAKDFLNFESYNLKDILKEELTYNMMPYIDDFKIVEEITKRENPETFLCLNTESSLAKNAAIFCNVKKIMHLGLKESIIKIRGILRRFSPNLRALFSSFLNNRELIKTNFRNNDNDKKILFTAYCNFDFYLLHSLIKLVEKKGEKFMILSNYHETQRLLRKEGIAYFSFGDFLKKKDKKEIKSAEKILEKEWRKVKDKLKKEMIYKKYNFWNVFGCELEHYLLTRVPLIINYIKSSKNIFADNKISIIVSMGDIIPMRRTPIEVAKKSNIPSITIQNGAYMRSIKMGIFPLISDVKSVWGKASKELLVKFGIDSERIIITGSMKLDDYIKKKKADKNTWKKIGLKKGEKFFLVAMQPLEDTFLRKENIQIIRKMINTMLEFPDMALIFKLHHRDMDTGSIICNILKETDEEIKNRIRVIKDADIINLISACEILFTVNSTTAVEAMFIKKPVVILDLFDVRHKGIFEKFDTIQKVTLKDDLTKIIKNNLDGNHRKKYLKKIEKFLRWYCYKLDGKATERVFSLIKKLKNKRLKE